MVENKKHQLSFKSHWQYHLDIQ